MQDFLSSALFLCTFDHLHSKLIVFTTRHDRVLHWIVLTHAGRHGLEQLPPIKSKKERRRVSLASTRIHHAVHCRHEEIICLPHEAIGNVDHKRALEGFRLHPVPRRLAQHLEPPARVLRHDGEALDVRVRPDAVLVVDGVRLRRVVQDSHAGLGVPRVRVKVRLGEVQGEREDVGEAAREVEELGVVGVEALAEAWDGGRGGPDAHGGGLG